MRVFLFCIYLYMKMLCRFFKKEVTQVETLWFGFDPPSKFEAWDVLNPIGIEVEIIASR